MSPVTISIICFACGYSFAYYQELCARTFIDSLYYNQTAWKFLPASQNTRNSINMTTSGFIHIYGALWSVIVSLNSTCSRCTFTRLDRVGAFTNIKLQVKSCVMQLVLFHKQLIYLGETIRFPIYSDDTQCCFEFRRNVFSGTHVAGSGRSPHMVISHRFLKGLKKPPDKSWFGRSRAWNRDNIIFWVAIKLEKLLLAGI